MSKLVNLDAMIRREDLEVEPDEDYYTGEGGIPVSDLMRGRIHYGLLRKPGFQRVTNDWDIDNVVTFIRSFRDGHLIPALILWRSHNGYNFVIDGAHRLSSLIAWVNDDYGDRELSRNFFNHRIPASQEKNAQECRERIAAEVGTYRDLSIAPTDEPIDRQRVRWASNIGQALPAQWIRGDAEMAETSFLTINQRAVQISGPEKYMILGRKKPHVIASRALVRSATGHKYWSRFPEENRNKIEHRAKQIYNAMFEPEDADLAKTIEMPVAGHPYSANALRVSLQLVSFANQVRTSRDLKEFADDADGTETLKHLDRLYNVVRHISGSSRATLALHPAVYFWGHTGIHNPSAVLASINFFSDLIERKQLVAFSLVRARFEEFIVQHGSIAKHVMSKLGGWEKSVPGVMEMYRVIFEGLSDGKDTQEVEQELISNRKFAGLAEKLTLESAPNSQISRETKRAVRRRELLKAAPRCPICYARMPSSAFSDDHIQRRQDGGRGNEENVQLTHPYCNTGLKEAHHTKGIPLPDRPDFVSVTG